MKIIRIITILFFVFILAIIVTADTGLLPGLIKDVYAFPNGDKAGHFLLLGIMAFLTNLSFPEKKLNLFSFGIPIGTILTAGLSVIEETSQSLFPSRSASLLDLFFSFLGIITFTILSTFIINRRAEKTTGKRL